MIALPIGYLQTSPELILCDGCVFDANGECSLGGDSSKATGICCAEEGIIFKLKEIK